MEKEVFDTLTLRQTVLVFDARWCRESAADGNSSRRWRPEIPRVITPDIEVGDSISVDFGISKVWASEEANKNGCITDCFTAAAAATAATEKAQAVWVDYCKHLTAFCKLLAQLAELFIAYYKLIKMLPLCVCGCVCVSLDVNQGETNRNRCTQRLVILRAHTY